MPDDSGASVAIYIGGLDRRFEGTVHRVELMVSRNLLHRTGLLLLKDNEVVEEVEQPLPVE